MRREQNKATAMSKGEVAKRPTSYKTSLSNPMPAGAGSKHLRAQSRSISPQRREVVVEIKSKKQER